MDLHQRVKTVCGKHAKPLYRLWGWQQLPQLLPCFDCIKLSGLDLVFVYVDAVRAEPRDDDFCDAVWKNMNDKQQAKAEKLLAKKKNTK